MNTYFLKFFQNMTTDCLLIYKSYMFCEHAIVFDNKILLDFLYSSKQKGITLHPANFF